MVGWSRFSVQKLENSEQTLRDLSGIKLTPELVQISESLFLHCHSTNEPEKPLLILLHGYGGSGICYFTIVQQLSQHYNLFLVDLLGMGRSSRPAFTCEGLEASEAFFVDSLEEMRRVKGFDSFVLIGHSFGGYISACYYMKHPEYVRSLVFLSPVGFNNRSEEQMTNAIAQSNWKMRLFLKLAIFLWDRHFSPFTLLRASGPWSKKWIKAFTRRRLPDLDPEIRNALDKYLSQMLLLPGSGEYAITHILLPGAWAKTPMGARLIVHVPMLFLYGDADWMSPNEAYVMQAQTDLIEVKIIQGASHQLFWDNPQGTADEIITFLTQRNL